MFKQRNQLLIEGDFIIDILAFYLNKQRICSKILQNKLDDFAFFLEIIYILKAS